MVSNYSNERMKGSMDNHNQNQNKKKDSYERDDVLHQLL